VRIPDLPIEYYDTKVLHFIGNRIGKTVKVGKNTLFQERGKYARICVEVELNKPLLAMFELKDRIYKIEYEGLHMLCFTCGRFGHYAEGSLRRLQYQVILIMKWRSRHMVRIFQRKVLLFRRNGEENQQDRGW
jgi:hypothetical protein